MILSRCKVLEVFEVLPRIGAQTFKLNLCLSILGHASLPSTSINHCGTYYLTSTMTSWIIQGVVPETYFGSSEVLSPKHGLDNHRA